MGAAKMYGISCLFLMCSNLSARGATCQQEEQPVSKRSNLSARGATCQQEEQPVSKRSNGKKSSSSITSSPVEAILEAKKKEERKKFEERQKISKGNKGQTPTATFIQPRKGDVPSM